MSPVSAPSLDELAPAAERFRHDPACTAPKLHGAVGRRDGRPLVVCSTCRVVAPLLGLLAGFEPATSAPKIRKRPSLYYCRAHLHPVNFRGRGCPQCAAETVPKRRRPRRAKDYETTPAIPAWNE